MSLPRASILFRPRRQAGRRIARRPAGIWWRRRVLPPGPLRLFHKAFIAIVGRADRCNIVPATRILKQFSVCSGWNDDFIRCLSGGRLTLPFWNWQIGKGRERDNLKFPCSGQLAPL